MTTLSIALFGSFRATLDGQPITRFESNKVRALLAYLAVEADYPHSRDELIGLLWPDQSEATARTNLRQALANLRLALGERGASAAFIRNTPDGIQFQNVDHHTLDVHTFSRLWAECKAHHHRRLETCRSCMQRLQQAIDLYRDDFLAHFLHSASAAFEEWVLARREHWRQAALDALYYLAQHNLLRGEYDQALRAARRQISLDAWREEAHRQVMQALALSGQRSAALAQFETCRRLLKQELNAEPARETLNLLEQIKSGQIAPDRPRQPDLPVAATPLLGRARELAEINRLLENPACRLLTLTGPGGIGKTRLARQAAIDQAGAFADHSHFVRLAPLSSAEFIVPAIAAALGLPLTGPDEPHAQLLRHLRPLETVVVLDNFEHLLTDGVGLIVEIMQHAPQIVLLVTSRERLNLAGEWALEVHGLDFPYSEATAQTESYAAIELFVQSARRIRPEFSLSADNRAAVQRICQLVEGLPLAIELAATWLNVLSCQQVARQLSENLALLNAARHGPTDQPAGLQSVFEQSWRMLTVEQRRVFQNLSVFRGGALFEAAQAVAGAELPALATLIDKSFIRRQGERYRVHELLRQYAAEKLAAAGETAEVRTRHAQFHLKLAEAAAAHMGGPEQAAWLDRLEAENDNFRAALDWSLACAATEETTLRLAVALSRFWQVRGYFSEAREWYSRALAQVANAPLTPLRAKVLFNLAYLAHLQCDYAVARHYHTLCLAARQEFGDERAIAESWRGLGITHHAQGDYALARTCYETSLILCRQVGDRSGEATSLSNLGLIAIDRSEHATARQFFEEGLAVRRELGDQAGIAYLLDSLGWAAGLQSDLPAAKELLWTSLVIRRELGDKWGMAYSFDGLGWVACAEGDHASATTYYRESLRLFREVGHSWRIAGALANLAGPATARGQWQRAAQLLGAAESLRELVPARLSPADCQEYEQRVASVRMQLTVTAFAAAWAQGRTLTQDQAIAYALLD